MTGFSQTGVDQTNLLGDGEEMNNGAARSDADKKDWNFETPKVSPSRKSGGRISLGSTINNERDELKIAKASNDEDKYAEEQLVCFKSVSAEALCELSEILKSDMHLVDNDMVFYPHSLFAKKAKSRTHSTLSDDKR